MNDGIDMAHSTWTNPENFQPKTARPASGPVEKVEACEFPGPDGWACDLKPGHAGDEHWADTGEPGGIRWRRPMVDASTLDGRSHASPGQVEVIDQDRIARIREVARKALSSQAPAAWAVALNKIEEMCNGTVE